MQVLVHNRGVGRKGANASAPQLKRELSQLNIDRSGNSRGAQCLSPMEFPRFSSSLPSTALFSTSVSIYILVSLLLHRFYVCFCLPVTLFLFLSLSRLSGSGRFFTFKLPTTAGESVAINMASYLSPCRGVFHSIRSLRPFLWPANDTLPRACLANRG